MTIDKKLFGLSGGMLGSSDNASGYIRCRKVS